MTYIVHRRNGRYEIRESRATPAGPRARTLATFTRLTEDVIDEARSRATTEFDADAVRRRASELGVPTGDDPTARRARDLLVELGRGRRPPPGLSRIIRDELAFSPNHGDRPEAELSSILPWLSAAPEARGATLVDLLLLGERIPQRRRGPQIAFPRIHSTS